jgi:DNA-binding NarL/FixJ family response regulator
MGREIRVVAVDDHYVVRRGVKSMIDEAEDMVLVGEGKCGEDVFRLVKEHAPDVLVLDISMPQVNSNEPHALPGGKNKFNIIIALSKLQRMYPNLPIVILSEKISHALIGGVLSRGVRSYLLKADELSKELIQAIRSVHKGGMFFSKTISDRMIQENSGTHAETITKRQKQILIIIAQNSDLPYSEIAEMLGITEQALKNQVTMINKKLGTKSARSAILKCISLGIIDFGEE